MEKYVSKALCILIVLLVAASLLPLTVYANGPAPSPKLAFKLYNLPAGTTYVDLAVCAPKTEVTDLAQDPPEGLTKDCALVCGQYDEYVSYSFRVRGAESNIVPDADGFVTFSHAGDIPKWGKVRLVMADSRGNILMVSDSFDIMPKGLFDYSLNTFEYNAAMDTLQMETAVSSIAQILYTVISVAGLILTCGVEWVIGMAFRLTDSYGKLILTTNAISQIAMRILFLVLYCILPQYILVMLLLEVLVYAGELAVYHIKMKFISTRRCLLYVIVANTTSLVLGMLLNLYVWNN